MDFFLITPIQVIEDPLPERKNPCPKSKRLTESKVEWVVLKHMERPGRPGALFPSAVAPKIVLNLLSTMREGRIDFISCKRRTRQQVIRRPTALKYIPVGLRHCEPHSWINSLMQLLLFLPRSMDLFSLIPRSFQPLREFADQYFTDQEALRAISLADSDELARCLIRKLPSRYFKKKVFLYEVLLALMKDLFPVGSSEEMDSILLHPEWHIVLDEERTIEKKLEERLPELFIGVKEPSSARIKKQYCLSSICYDLDAFIELRPDGENVGNFITYLKVDGVWYQCEDDRVIHLRSTCLKIPFRGAVLLHYRQVALQPYCGS